jgi:predicted DNA-binding protein
MARTYKTVSLSLPPGVAKALTKIGRHTGRTGARVAAEIVLRGYHDGRRRRAELRR